MGRIPHGNKPGNSILRASGFNGHMSVAASIFSSSHLRRHLQHWQINISPIVNSCWNSASNAGKKDTNKHNQFLLITDYLSQKANLVKFYQQMGVGVSFQ